MTNLKLTPEETSLVLDLLLDTFQTRHDLSFLNLGPQINPKNKKFKKIYKKLKEASES